MVTKQPKWKTVEYSRNQIIKAGKIIKKDNRCFIDNFKLKG